MSPDELRGSLKQQPFEPFRVVITDGVAFDIRHPDLLWIGQRTAYVGLTGTASQTLFERTVKIDISHIVRIEPIDSPSAKNEPSQN